MKIFAARIATETNTFSGICTRLSDFEVRRGAGAPGGPAHSGFDIAETWGDQAKALGHEFVFSLDANAQPSGITMRAAYEALRNEMLRDLRAALPVDVVLLMLHGAMVAEGYEDCEEDIIRRARNVVGADAVIGVELDLHCHLSESKISAADVVVTYKEYPHVDVSDRAVELFELAVATRQGKLRPTMALFDCQMLGLYPTTREPMRGFVDSIMGLERRGEVLSISFGHGFPFADVPHMGAKVLAITNDHSSLAEELAREIGLRAYSLRRQIGLESLSLPMEAALSKALTSDRPPVVVADQSDNIGGGAPGDATFALRWLIDHGAEDAAMAIFYDPEVVASTKDAGRGSRRRIELGGKLGPLSGDPVSLDVVVLSMIDDYMHCFPQKSAKARMFPTGDVVALRCGSIDIVVSSKRCQCFSPSIFTDLGIDPTRKRLLVPKSAQHFYTAFAPIAGEMIYMAAPGAVAPDPRQIPYRRLDTRRLYPWLEDPLEIDSTGKQ